MVSEMRLSVLIVSSVLRYAECVEACSMLGGCVGCAECEALMKLLSVAVVQIVNNKGECIYDKYVKPDDGVEVTGLILQHPDCLAR